MRLVCQVWSQVGSLCHRKMSRSYIRIGQNFNKPPEFDEILSKSSHGSNFPLGNFELCPDVFQPKYEPFLEAFFCTSSSLMLTSLSIRLDVQSTLNFARTLDSLPQLPRLKNLSFEDRRSNTVAFDEIFRILVQASAQNLESLTIRRKPSHGAQAYGQELQDNHHEVTMMARICDTFGTIVLRNLKNLQMDLLMWDELLICLSNRLAPLFSLSLCLKTSNFEVKSGSLHALLQSQSQTLINLRLDGFCKKSQLRIDFPIFGRLQLLQIQGWCHNLPGVEYSAFSYAQNFPVLKELILDTWSFQPSWRQFLAWNSDQFNGGGSLSRIKLPQEMLELELISNDMPMTFSNLKSLTLHFQPALLLHSSLLLETVFENLETLEELRILGSFCEFDSPKCLDPLLTGLDAKECQRMIRVNNFFNVISDESNDNLDRRPSLACLKSIVTFTLMAN